MAARVLDDEAPAESVAEPFVAPFDGGDVEFAPEVAPLYVSRRDAQAAAVVKEPTISAAQVADERGGIDKAMRQIKKQTMVRIRVPKIMGPQVVVINGARFNVPCNVFLEVPRQVAEILQESGRI